LCKVSTGTHTGVHHQESVESGVLMKNAGVKCWTLSGLYDDSSRTTHGKEEKGNALPYLLRDQEDTRFYLLVLAF